MRDELNDLRRTELELEHKVEAGRTQLNELLKNISQTHGQITQVRGRWNTLIVIHVCISIDAISGYGDMT